MFGSGGGTFSIGPDSHRLLNQPGLPALGNCKALLYHQESRRRRISIPSKALVIADEGSGLPQEELQDIYKPFFTTKEDGTGLGLTNTIRILDAHGGWLEAENRKPHGAAFRVYLPV